MIQQFTEEKFIKPINVEQMLNHLSNQKIQIKKTRYYFFCNPIGKILRQYQDIKI